jgi:hypothetical protein
MRNLTRHRLLRFATLAIALGTAILGLLSTYTEVGKLTQLALSLSATLLIFAGKLTIVILATRKRDKEIASYSIFSKELYVRKDRIETSDAKRIQRNGPINSKKNSDQHTD